MAYVTVSNWGFIGEPIIQDCIQEAATAHEKHGKQSMLYGSDDKSLRILIEEIGEVAREMNELALGNIDRETYLDRLDKELVQVTAMGLTWLAKIRRQ